MLICKYMTGLVSFYRVLTPMHVCAYLKTGPGFRWRFLITFLYFYCWKLLL